MARSQVLSLRFPDARILIFAKAPELGRVKTRLIPVLGAQGAADLHERMLRDKVRRLESAGLAPVELWCAPDPGQYPFPELADRYGIGLYRQRGADLGERMLNAAVDALRRGNRVALVGTDCPLLDARYLEQALAAMSARDAVLGPAMDGGYVLLALKLPESLLFRDMPWGGDKVAAKTRQRMKDLGWEWAELPALPDVDRPEDLAVCEPFLPPVMES